MHVKTRGLIGSFSLPRGFKLVNEELGGHGDNWMFVYAIDDAESASITASYRGFPVLELRADPFRELLIGGDSIVFSKKDGINTEKIPLISRVLGNAGDNQLNNPDKGKFGPAFEIEDAVILNVAKKAVLKVDGFFHDENMNPISFFSGIFIDGSPKNSKCDVEEFYFQAKTEELFKKYSSSFEESLESIVWVNR